MAILKPREIDNYLTKPAFAQCLFLVYGPDSGLVTERADKLAKNSGVDLTDPFCLTRLDADEAAESGRILEEAHTVAMFGGKRLIRISGATRRDLYKAITPVLESPPDDTIIIIEAGDLKKSSALRKNLESSPQSLCIPCYADDDHALDQLITEEIEENSLKIGKEARHELKQQLGSDRRISRGELQKLATFCSGRKEVTVDDIRLMVGDASRLVTEDLIDATITGNSPVLQKILPKAIGAGSPPDMILLAVLRQFQTLQAARTKIELNRQQAGNVIAGMRPPVHFTRKQAITTAITIWPLVRIGKALSRLDKAMLDCRMNPGLANSLAGTALLALSLEAKALRRH